MTPRLIFIRHGATAFNSTVAKEQERYRGWSDLPLIKEGLQQARRLAHRFKHVPLQRIYTSNLQRAYHVAAAIQQAHVPPIPLGATEELRPWNVGDFTGRSVHRHNDSLLQYQLQRPDEKVPGGESFSDFLRRFLPFLAMAFAEALDSPRPIMLVTHTRDLRAADGWVKAGMKGLTVDAGPLKAEHHLHPGEGLEYDYVDGKWHRREVIHDVGAKRGTAAARPS